MAIHERAGNKATQNDLVNIPRLMSHYYRIVPNGDDPAQRVSFGTSGHRGSSFSGSFNQNHIWAITQAVVDYRQSHGIEGSLYLGMDTHALSEAAYISAIEVLLANNVKVLVQENQGFTPTPVISHAIVSANRNAHELSDGILLPRLTIPLRMAELSTTRPMVGRQKVRLPPGLNSEPTIISRRSWKGSGNSTTA